MTDVIRDNGPWHVGVLFKRAHVYSDDFTHDVTLEINGDFADEEQIRAYAEGLCEALNSVLKSELSADHRCIWRERYEEVFGEIRKKVHKPVPSVSMDGEPFGDPHPLDACKGTSERTD